MYLYFTHFRKKKMMNESKEQVTKIVCVRGRIKKQQKQTLALRQYQKTRRHANTIQQTHSHVDLARKTLQNTSSYVPFPFYHQCLFVAGKVYIIIIFFVSHWKPRYHFLLLLDTNVLFIYHLLLFLLFSKAFFR